MVRTRLNIGCRYSTPVLERPLHPTRSQFKPEASQTQAPVTPATEPERRAGGGFTANRISVRFISEWRHRDTGQWYRTFGNEHWEFAPDGLQNVLDLSANDIPIDESERSL